MKINFKAINKDNSVLVSKNILEHLGYNEGDKIVVEKSKDFLIIKLNRCGKKYSLVDEKIIVE